MIGDVSLGEDVSVWPTAVIRGDVERIVIGARSNVQDGAVIHADPGKPTIVGEDCVIGHRAVVHGTILEDGVLVGMGAVGAEGDRHNKGPVMSGPLGVVVLVAATGRFCPSHRRSRNKRAKLRWRSRAAVFQAIRGRFVRRRSWQLLRFPAGQPR